MSFRIVIPARYCINPAAGKAARGYRRQADDRACRRGGDALGRPAACCVATDDERVAAAVRASDYEVVMTRADHPSGTDRIAEVAQTLGWNGDEIVVNVQGDEPLLDPALIDEVAFALEADADCRDVHGIPRPAIGRGILQSECRQGGLRRGRPCLVFQSRSDSLGSRRILCRDPDRIA
jgi:CMP-2-keto-3-deoxyoctulosonic acid synthetase